jgi:antitoxin PrlF
VYILQDYQLLLIIQVYKKNINIGGNVSKENNNAIAEGNSNNDYCCKVESIITIDERGQMILPKEIRKRAGFNAGDKVALLVSENEGKICCITMIPADDLAKQAKDMLGPLVKSLG